MHHSNGQIEISGGDNVVCLKQGKKYITIDIALSYRKEHRFLNVFRFGQLPFPQQA